MYVPQNPIHYTPSSVGGLMDTAFLRRAALSAGGEHEAAGRAHPSLLAHLLQTLTRLSRRTVLLLRRT